MNLDFQTRMTNDEIRRNDQIRMTKPATAQLRAIGHSGFGFLWSLVIGHSTTFANPVHDPNACEKTRKGALQEQPLPLNRPVEPEDRDRSPFAARGPRQPPGKITQAPVLPRPLRAGTARGPNLIGSWSQCMRKAKGYPRAGATLSGKWQVLNPQ